jgi:hypothetical protein
MVVASVKASASNIVLGLDAAESPDIVSDFATHGLLAGEVAEFTQLNAELALVLTLLEKPTQLDDGLLTASDVAQAPGAARAR